MPTTTVNIHQAETHLLRLLDQAAQGHDIVIAKAGKPASRQAGGAAGAAVAGARAAPAGRDGRRGVIPDDIKAGFEAAMAGMFHPGA